MGNTRIIGISSYTIGINDNIFGAKFITFPLEIMVPMRVDGSYISLENLQVIVSGALLLAEREVVAIHGLDFHLGVGAQSKYSQAFAGFVKIFIDSAIGDYLNRTEIPYTGSRVKASIGLGTPVITTLNNNCQ